MTDKELKRMSRGELLQMLISQMKQNRQLQSRLEDAEKQLEDRRIAIGKSGSIAEASLQLNCVFEAAQAAAEQYLENLQLLERQRAEIAVQIEKAACQKADKMLKEADEYSRNVRKSADEYYQEICEKAQRTLNDQNALVEWILAGEREHIDEAQQGRGKGKPKP